MKDYIDLFSDENWVEAPEYSDNTLKKVLHDSDDLRITLIRLPAGFEMAPHSHLMSEHHIILRGEYESDGDQYLQGTYRSFEPHQKHGPFASENGAIVLVIWKKEKV